jgi:carboxyl-terminal processing protease
MLYTQRDQDAARPHRPEDMKLTDGQRPVYSGGGIEPDHFVPGPIDGFNPSAFARMLRSRQAFVGFAERFTKEGDNRPGARSAATHRVAPGWAVTDAMVDEFREFLRAERVTIDEAAFSADLSFIKAMIHYEVDIDLFGVEEARRSISAIDPQLQAALGHFDEAQSMLEQAARRAAGRVPVAAAAR